jgi:hypothetical protein
VRKREVFIELESDKLIRIDDADEINWDRERKEVRVTWIKGRSLTSLAGSMSEREWLKAKEKLSLNNKGGAG